MSVSTDVPVSESIFLNTVVMVEESENRKLRGVMKFREPMSKHTSWRTGGPADKYYKPADIEDLGNFLAGLGPDEFCLWLGLGSNILVRDGGIRGCVCVITGVLDDMSMDHTGKVKCGAGVTNAKFARFTSNSGLTGVEFLAGIPGTIGGALAMNAGAFGGETWDNIYAVETINRDGKINYRTRDEFEVGYRKVKMEAGEWFISAEFQLRPDPNHSAHNRIREFLSLRAESQPTGESSCGSVFRNPPGDHAARLIDACGLKGKRVGSARVSEKHANFIINDGGAASSEIEELIYLVQRIVKEKTGTELVPEVRIVGEPGC